jgi:hypothetical protein
MGNIAYGVISTTNQSDVSEVGWQTPDGSYFGVKSTNKISFYGATPIVQPSGIATAVASTATTTSIQSSLNSLINAFSAAASGLGLIA